MKSTQKFNPVGSWILLFSFLFFPINMVFVIFVMLSNSVHPGRSFPQNTPILFTLGVVALCSLWWSLLGPVLKKKKLKSSLARKELKLKEAMKLYENYFSRMIILISSLSISFFLGFVLSVLSKKHVYCISGSAVFLLTYSLFLIKEYPFLSKIFKRIKSLS